MSKDKIIHFEDSKTSLVRPMTPTSEDYSALARCFNSFKDPNSWPDGFGGTLIFDEPFVEKRFSSRDLSTHFIINDPEDRSKIVGTCFINKAWNLPDSWYVGLLGVDPANQGQKLGKTLLIRATKYAMDQNARLITLHTWGGNLKAMPLYKRQGYKWRPDTTVYMENFIPQILNFPYFQKLFTQFSWYDTFKPIITQKPDNELEENMRIYSYPFEFNNDSNLKVWIDRTIGLINGFHLKQNNSDILIKAITPKSEAYIGFEEFPITLTITNNSTEPREIELDISSSKQIQLTSNQEIKTLRLESKGKEELTVYGKFMINTEELDQKVHDHSYTEHSVTFNVKIDNKNTKLSVGKVPIYAIKAVPNPVNLSVDSYKEMILPIIFQNFLTKSQKVKVIVSNGSEVEFKEHEFLLEVSKFDSKIDIPMKIPKINTKVDYFNVKVIANGDTYFDQKIPIAIINESKTIQFEYNQEIIVENKYLRVTLFKNPQPGSNELNFYNKKTGLQIKGFPIILGYPFDDEGSEFYTIKHEHKFKDLDNGLKLISLAKSSDKPGIQVSRILTIFNDDEPFSINYKVENNSSNKWSNLGIQIPTYWWPGQLPFIESTIPFNEGIKSFRDFMELSFDAGTDPNSLKEGWRAGTFITGTLGIIFDHQKVDKILIGRSFPIIDFKFNDLEQGQAIITSSVYFMFTDSWQSVRRKWIQIYQPKAQIERKFYQRSRNCQEIGIGNQIDYVNTGLILDKRQKSFNLLIKPFKEANIKGKIDFSLDIPNYKTKVMSFDKKDNQLIEELLAPETQEKMIKGNLKYDSGTRIYIIPINIGFFDSQKRVSVQKTEENEYEIDNGLFILKGSEKYRGTIYQLNIKDNKNELLTFYPDAKPFLWFNKFFGGLYSSIRQINSHDMEDFDNLSFTSKEITKGMWKGINFTSEVIKNTPKIRGLQLSTNYLTLPDSPFILVEIEINNHSEVDRDFTLDLSMNFKPSNGNDRYFTRTKKNEIAEYKFADYESRIWSQKAIKTLWAAYYRESCNYYFGVIIPEKENWESTYNYAPNKSYISLGRNVVNAKITSKSNMTFYTMFIITKDLESIEPYTKTNFRELLS